MLINHVYYVDVARTKSRAGMMNAYLPLRKPTWQQLSHNQPTKQSNSHTRSDRTNNYLTYISSRWMRVSQRIRLSQRYITLIKWIRYAFAVRWGAALSSISLASVDNISPMPEAAADRPPKSSWRTLLYVACLVRSFPLLLRGILFVRFHYFRSTHCSTLGSTRKSASYTRIGDVIVRSRDSQTSRKREVYSCAQGNVL